MMDAAGWLTALTGTNTPALPQAWAMQGAVSVGWALVLALLGALLGSRMPIPARRGLAAVLALWTLLPGPLSPDYWLGLAFHAPSLSGMLLCLFFLQRWLFSPGSAAAMGSNALAAAPRVGARDWLLPAVAVAVGYALLLDTFAVLPWEIYAWGFSPALLLLLLALCLLPWVLRGHAAMGVLWWIAPVALLLFAATRLPTGNLWDALLDPILWLLLQWLLLRHLFKRRRV